MPWDLLIVLHTLLAQQDLDNLTYLLNTINQLHHWRRAPWFAFRKRQWMSNSIQEAKQTAQSASVAYPTVHRIPNCQGIHLPIRIEQHGLCLRWGLYLLSRCWDGAPKIEDPTVLTCAPCEIPDSVRLHWINVEAPHICCKVWEGRLDVKLVDGLQELLPLQRSDDWSHKLEVICKQILGALLELKCQYFLHCGNESFCANGKCGGLRHCCLVKDVTRNTRSACQVDGCNRVLLSMPVRKLQMLAATSNLVRGFDVQIHNATCHGAEYLA
mmetsp:Transcript_13751/g.24542  ORF Transcript_13751/g.24542 Transcript_13751/m.24542 type:complete len:270 (-) Transcript_13751:98-907(-)